MPAKNKKKLKAKKATKAAKPSENIAEPPKNTTGPPETLESPKNTAIPPKNIIEPHQIRSFLVVTVTYVVSVALLALILGTTVATIIATPIWAFLYVIYSRLDRESTPSSVGGWIRLVKPPPLNYWNLLWIIVTILFVQACFGFLAAEFTDPIISDDPIKDFFAQAENTSLLVTILVAALCSYVVGGYVAAKLPNFKCPAPYRHGVVATVICNTLSFSVMIPLAMLTNDEDAPTREDIGFIILLTFPTYLASALGTWLAIRKRGRIIQRVVATGIPKLSPDVDSNASLDTSQAPQEARRLWRRRPIQIAALALILIILVSVVAWRVRTHRQVTVCPNPPATAMLNYWPVSYVSGSAEMCHDLPAVDATLVTSNQYSRSREEWEHGLTAHSGDEVFIMVYINNGAGDNAEEINPGRGIARDVRLTTDVDSRAGSVHYIRVEFSGQNTNTVVNRFKINTDAQDRLEVQPNSGEIFNFTSTELIAKDLNVGNSTIMIGDLAPKWEASVFVRFRVKVVE